MPINNFDELFTALTLHIDLRIDGLRTEFINKFDGLRTEFNNKFDGLRTEFNDKFDGLRTEFNNKFDGLRTEFNGFRIEIIERLDQQDKSLEENRIWLREQLFKQEFLTVDLRKMMGDINDKLNLYQAQTRRKFEDIEKKIA